MLARPPRPVLVSVGSAMTTFLVVAAVTIELVGTEIAAGIVGVIAGGVASLAVLILVGLVWERIGDPLEWLLVGYATVGPAMLGLALLRYVNVPGADAYLTVRRTVAIALGAAVLVTVITWWIDRSADSN